MIQNSKFKIQRFVVGAAVMCFVLMNSFVKFQSTNIRHYKTFADTVFDTNDIVRTPKIIFNFDKATIWQDSTHHGMDSLRLVFAFIQDHPSFVIEVGTHTDHVCTDCSTRLTYNRAISITDSLIKMGIERERIVAKSYGDVRPVILENDLTLPSGKIVQKGTVLFESRIDKIDTNRRGADNQYMRMLDRRTELKILRTDFMPAQQK
ncbi:MAG: OmpA family protein [Bacteroidetes bacterium]|nr:OmpA family protein [Bacteroidota bacterium]